MADVDLSGGASMLLLVGLAWVPVGWLVGSVAWMLAGVAMASAGLILAGFTPAEESESMALGADDLEREEVN